MGRDIVYVLQSNSAKTAEEVFTTYKKRWGIETFYQYLKIINNAISTHEILLMARCMKMERRGNSWNLKNARKRDLQILKQMGFEPKMTVAD